MARRKKPARSFILRLPWPDTKLNPHAKGHWRPKAAATKQARETAFWIAKEAGLPRIPNARLVFSFYPPDHRRRDLHNMPATMKAAIDGIAQAMGCDDNGFVVSWPEQFGSCAKGGCVLVEVEDYGTRGRK